MIAAAVTVPEPTWWDKQIPWTQTGIILLAALVVYVAVRKLILGRLEKIAAATDNDVDDRLVDFFKAFFGIVVFFAALLLVFRAHGLKLTPWLAGAGIAGIAIGLAARETLADILSGVFLITDRPMRVGDRVKIERIGRDWGGWGDVVDIGLRRTNVRNTDGVVVSYPNNVLANSVITNFSHEVKPVRVRVRFQVGYDADLSRVIEIARAAITRTDGVIPNTAEVVVRTLWDDGRGHLSAGALCEGRYRIEDVRERTRARSRVLTNLLADLRDEGIPLPSVGVTLGDRPRA
jgi:small-conductance mechanosensitive channel